MISSFVYFLLADPDYIKAAFSFLLIILLTLELIRYVNKSNRDFRDFIHLLKSNDFSTRYHAKGKGRSFEMLYKELNQLSKKYYNLNLEKELKHRHLQTVLSHVDIGIISYDSNNNIQLINHALTELLEIPFVAQNQSLHKLDDQFIEAIKGLNAGDNSLFRITIGSRELHLAMQANVYKLKQEEFKLVSVKNILGELEQKELESYQKLIRVLTHEIMNSITPIASLSNTLDSLLHEQEIQNNTELAEQVKEGVAAIHDRSSNLLGFTQSYRKLTRLPQPEFENIQMDTWLQHTRTIVNSLPGVSKINFEWEIEPGIVFKADPKMMEQVLMNIYKNAIEALDDVQKKEISTTVFKAPNHRIHIEIHDSGPGMKAETVEKIFIPFYTTKKEGSGIGLSLSRQIILAHHGHIKAESKEGMGTIVTIIL